MNRILVLTACLLLQLVWAQQLRLVQVNDEKYPAVEVTLEVLGATTEPQRADFVAREGDRPYPLDMLLQQQPGSRKPSRQVLILLDAGPGAAGTQLLHLKKAATLALEQVPAHTQVGIAYFHAGGTENFQLLQEPTEKSQNYREALQRVYSNPDSSGSYCVPASIGLALDWLEEHKNDLLTELIVLTVADGIPLRENDMEDLQARAEVLQIPIHILAFNPRNPDVVDQLRQLADKSDGQAKKATNPGALQAALKPMVGAEENAKPRLQDYTVLLTVQSTRPEDGKNYTLEVVYKGRSLKVPYIAASAAYRAEGSHSFLHTYRYYFMLAGGGLLLLALLAWLIARQRRLRRNLAEERQRHLQAEAKIKAQYEKELAEKQRLIEELYKAEGGVVLHRDAPELHVPARLTTTLSGQSFVFALSSPLLTLGRDPECDISLPDTTVSPRHAVLRREGEAWWLQDLQSANGTLLNGLRVDSATLRVGDVIEIGTVLLKVE